MFLFVYIYIGEERSIPRVTLTWLICNAVPELDAGLLAHLEHEEIAMLYWHFFRMRGDTKLMALGLVNAYVKEMATLLQKRLQSVSKPYGGPGGLMGLVDDLSNIRDVSSKNGWEASFFPRKILKRQQTFLPVTRQPYPGVLAIEDGHAAEELMSF